MHFLEKGGGGKTNLTTLKMIHKSQFILTSKENMIQRYMYLY